MIKNPNLFIKHIAEWLAKYAKDNGRKTFVLHYCGRATEAVLIKVCVEATKEMGGLSMIVGFEPGAEIEKIYSARKVESDFINTALMTDEVDLGLLLLPVTRTEAMLRNHHKKFVLLGDVFPFLDVKQSDITGIAEKFWPDVKFNDEKIVGIQSPEGLLDLEDNYGIITSEEMPSKHSRWPYLMQYQKKDIAFAHQREKLTRHKAIIGKPFPSIRDQKHLC